MGMSKLLVSESLKYYLTTEATISRPTGWELSLHTGDPGADGTNNEVGDATYARQGVTFEMTTNLLGDAYAQNDVAVIFPVADAAYTVTHLVLWDGAGNMLVTQALRTPKVIGASEQAQVAPGEIKIGEVV